MKKLTEIVEDRPVKDVVKVFGPLITILANDIFLSHRTKLLTKPITYITLAIWGPDKDSRLTDDQLTINRQVNLFVKQIFESLDLKDQKPEEVFIIDFRIRGSIISKIDCMIKAFKDGSDNIIYSGGQNADIFRDIMPFGSA